LELSLGGRIGRWTEAAGMLSSCGSMMAATHSMAGCQEPRSGAFDGRAAWRFVSG
jgi:hypothetical protein